MAGPLVVDVAKFAAAVKNASGVGWAVGGLATAGVVGGVAKAMGTADTLRSADVLRRDAESRYRDGVAGGCAVVSRESLSTAGWPDGAPGRNALDVHVLRLRRRLAPLSLVIRTVRSRGYLLEVESAKQGTVVTLTVSKGPDQVSVPDVTIGLPDG